MIRQTLLTKWSISFAKINASIIVAIWVGSLHLAETATRTTVSNSKFVLETHIAPIRMLLVEDSMLPVTLMTVHPLAIRRNVGPVVSVLCQDDLISPSRTDPDLIALPL